jgi:hypothetical protein
LNLAYGFGFLNRGEEQKGKTKYWENQGHMYGRKWGYDFYAQFYKGYYLYPKDWDQLIPIYIISDRI